MPAVPGGVLRHKPLRQRVLLLLSGGHFQHEPGDDVLRKLRTMCSRYLQLRARGLCVRYVCCIQLYVRSDHMHSVPEWELQLLGYQHYLYGMCSGKLQLLIE